MFNEYIAVVGSRAFHDETAIHTLVKRLLDNGYGIASGGAAGADHHALTGILRFNPKAGKVFTVGSSRFVAQSEVKPLLELQRKGGILRVGRIHSRVSYEQYAQALLKRSEDLVKDPTVKGVVAFVDPAAENAGTWHTAEAAIVMDKRLIVHTADEKALQSFPDGYWRRLPHNPDAYLWVVRYSRPIVTIENGRWKETIEKRHGSPSLIARSNQLQDGELLAGTPRIPRVSDYPDTDAFPPPFDRSACLITRWSPPLPPPDRAIGSYTVDVCSISEAIEKANPDQAPQFSNALDRMIWEGHMNASGNQAFREDLAEPRIYRQIPHIAAQTGAAPAEAAELRQYWDILGDTPELYRFYLADTKERGIPDALAYYHTLAESLEKATRVSPEDITHAWACVPMAEDGDEDDGDGLPLEDLGDGDIRTWIPLGESKDLPWMSQQPKWYQDLLDAIEEAMPADLPALGKELYEKAQILNKSQRTVAFETYARAKEKALAWAERHLQSDALKVKRAILKAKGNAQLAQLGQRMHQGQNEGKAEINPREWSVLWNIYRQKKAKAMA